jgi:hypothetical protein
MGERGAAHQPRAPHRFGKAEGFSFFMARAFSIYLVAFPRGGDIEGYEEL